MLRQIKYLDNYHIDAIEPEEDKDSLDDKLLEASIAREKTFILSKFAKFHNFSVDELLSWAKDALNAMPEEDDEDLLIKKKIKKPERKHKAFEKETFDVFDYENENELENEDSPDENTPKDIKKKMWRS